MDFPIRQIGDKNIQFYESGADSDVQFVFIPGGLNPEIWRNQLRYFSKNYKVISFQPAASKRDYREEKECLEAILKLDCLENVVLVSTIFGGGLAQDFEEHDSVEATVISGAREKFETFLPRPLFNLSFKIGSLEPKLVKKYFFCDYTDYKVAKDFVKDLKSPNYRDFRSILKNYSFTEPSNNCLIIHPEDDNLSDLEYVKSLNCSVSVLNCCGTFSFYEKPQEFNKALLDFIPNRKEEKSLSLEEIKKSNKSLKDFERNKIDKQRNKEKRQEKAKKLLKIKNSRKR